jgi:hypothetical protein
MEFPGICVVLSLGYQFKTGHTLSVQNRPTGLAEDVIVLPCCSVRLQGADRALELLFDIVVLLCRGRALRSDPWPMTRGWLRRNR